jgi:serine/threonine-protein kinase
MVRDAVVKTGDMVEGRYRIIKTLGAGGMGTVFLAEHALIKRRVAIKILHPDLATDAHVVERFMNEARAAGTLGHPNIVESTDMGFTQDHVPYIVFEYLEGSLLTDEIYRVGGLPVRRAVRIASQIASALEAALRANIVHRDLKSDNIFLTDKDDELDHVKVLDFGVSRFLEADERQRNMVVGTPEFMAPEQITDPAHVDKRADIYALGVILYEMLTARRPFSNEDDPRALMHRIVTKAPPPLLRNEVPHGLSTLILDKLLAKDRDHRFQTMGDVAAALEQFITRGDGTPVPSRRRSRPMVAAPFEDTPETSARLPPTGSLKPIAARDTPWPVDTLDRTPTAMGQVSLPPHPPVKRPYALYGVAGAGILMGMIGLVVGLRGGKDEAAHAQPPVVVQTAPAAAAPAPAAAQPTKIDVSLDADVTGARVVFRRRVHEAPAKMVINATDVVELVEVAAPGYKTTRYWLTFDRPTYLKAHLVRGSGSIEATEEETLVALGEVIMVTGTAPAAQPAQPAIAATTQPAPASAQPAKVVDKTLVAAAPTTPTPAAKMPAPPAATPAAAPQAHAPDTQVALAPRKIGRAAAEADQSAAPAPAPVVEQPKPEPAVTPAPVAQTEAKPIEHEAPKDLPKPETAAKEPPKDDIPTVDRATVSSVIATHRPEVLKCFAEGKKKNPAMKGTLSLQLQVAANGSIHRVQVQSTLNNPLVAACVVKAANSWKFPARAGQELATVAYPFTIN